MRLYKDKKAYRKHNNRKIWEPGIYYLVSGLGFLGLFFFWKQEFGEMLNSPEIYKDRPGQWLDFTFTYYFILTIGIAFTTIGLAAFLILIFKRKGKKS